MKFKIIITDSALRDYRKINNPFKDQIKTKIDELCNFNNETKNVKMLKGEFKGLFRLRIGDYRIIFRTQNESLIIISILHRKDVYK